MMKYSIALVMAASIAGCSSQPQQTTQEAIKLPTQAARVKPDNTAIHFQDITAAAGIKFRHTHGAFGAKLLPESMGSGAVFFDYNNDGYPDIFFVNSRPWNGGEVEAYQKAKWSASEFNFYRSNNLAARRPHPITKSRRVTSALYRNNGQGGFTDVTAGSGLDVAMYGMGAAAGDYDNDGRPDLYVTGYGRNYLFHNRGSGRFAEVAQAAGVRDGGWSTSAAWLDYDKDGRLDLFVCRYLKWTPATEVFSTVDGRNRTYTGPQFYVGEMNRLYHNRGSINGVARFEDVSQSSGISHRLARQQTASGLQPSQELRGKALGVAIGDFNNDHWPDIVVANDKVANYLFLNNRNGTFSEVGIEAGLAFSHTGEARAGMGVDAADIDNSGRDSIMVGNGNHEMLALYLNNGRFFTDLGPNSSIGQATLTAFTFGCAFVDLNNDSWLDIVMGNGHIREEIRNTHPDVTYAQRPLLFMNQGRGHFREIGRQAGAALQQPLVARGLAAADLDRDGDVDLLLTCNGGPPRLLRNDTAATASAAMRGHAVRITLIGSRSNSSALGALVEARLPALAATSTTARETAASETAARETAAPETAASETAASETAASGVKLRRWVRSGSSYLSQSELPLTLGLGQAMRIDTLRILWPSGKSTQLAQLAAGFDYTIHEDKGLIRKLRLTQR